jgi:hypothetical protein
MIEKEIMDDRLTCMTCWDVTVLDENYQCSSCARTTPFWEFVKRWINVKKRK